MKTEQMRFVAINYIACREEYRERFEELFATRAKAIDRMPGFLGMHVLRPKKQAEEYLIVSHWEDETAFRNWTSSQEFIEGHKRGFADVRAAEERGDEAPMSSSFRIYEVIAQ